LQFDCAGESLVGIVAQPADSANVRDVGVVRVVGGPQYRVGSHRQFVLLARVLAEAGYAVLRFDVRGMGDSAGSPPDFAQLDHDIAAAVDALIETAPQVRRIVLWGLCDAASANLLYWQATRDVRLAGMVLLNPWVRSEQTLAQAHVRHYYGRRLFSPEFWSKLLRGRLNIVQSIKGFVANWRLAHRDSAPGAVESSTFQGRMQMALANFPGPMLIVLSGDDYTAKEFLTWLDNEPERRGLLGLPNVRHCDIAGADHTFSRAEWRQSVECCTIDWLREMERACDAS